MSRDPSLDPKTGDIVDLASFRKKKEVADNLSHGRQPLYMSHVDGKVTGSPHFDGKHTDNFGDRLSRIRTSLEKINRLMAELKKVASDQDAAKK